MKPLKGCYLIALVVPAIITSLSNPSLTELGYSSICQVLVFNHCIYLPPGWSRLPPTRSLKVAQKSGKIRSLTSHRSLTAWDEVCAKSHARLLTQSKSGEVGEICESVMIQQLVTLASYLWTWACVFVHAAEQWGGREKRNVEVCSLFPRQVLMSTSAHA